MDEYSKYSYTVGNYKISYRFKVPNKITDYDYSYDKSRRYISYLKHIISFYDRYTDNEILSLEFITDELYDFMYQISYIINEISYIINAHNTGVWKTSPSFLTEDGVAYIIECFASLKLSDRSMKSNDKIVIRYEYKTENIIIYLNDYGINIKLSIQEAEQLLSIIYIPSDEEVEEMIRYAEIQKKSRFSDRGDSSGAAFWPYGFNIIK